MSHLPLLCAGNDVCTPHGVLCVHKLCFEYSALFVIQGVFVVKQLDVLYTVFNGCM